jgi:hypothetical protein
LGMFGLVGGVRGGEEMLSDIVEGRKGEMDLGWNWNRGGGVLCSDREGGKGGVVWCCG